MAAAATAQAVPAIAGLGLNLFEMLHSNRMYKQGMQMFENTPFPEYQIPQEELQNQSIAARMAMTGMPSEQYQQGLQGISRNQQFGLNALQSRGGSIAGVNALVGEGNQGTLGLDVQSAEQRLANEGQLMNVNQSLAGYRDKAYQINKLQRYLMRLGMASSMMQQGGQGFNSSLNNLAGTLASQGGEGGGLSGLMGMLGKGNSGGGNLGGGYGGGMDSGISFGGNMG